MVYLKDINNGVAVADSVEALSEDFVIITKEEFDEIVAQHEAQLAPEEVE